MNKFIHTFIKIRAVGYIVILLLFSFATGAKAYVANDSLYIQRSLSTDSLMKHNEELRLNKEAVTLIQFDFFPSEKKESNFLKSTPINKPWMDFQVDLSVPKNMLDTTKVRRPENYIRMLPYSIWTKFGENPVFDVLVFGNKKRLEITWNLNLDDLEEFGRNMIPNAGRFNPNSNMGGASIVIGNLDFIGFLYNNLNKQGRIRKHNRKYANAWKSYNNAPFSADEGALVTYIIKDSIQQEGNIRVGESGELYHHLNSIKLLEDAEYNEYDKPNHQLLQSTDLRSRFGNYTDPELYALPSSVSDKGNEKNEKERHQKKRRKHSSKNKSKEEHDEVIQELPNSMDDLYKYIKIKQEQDSIQRKDFFKKDKINQNVYELEQQQRKLRERQN